jgi:hypothetical protein
MADTIFNKFKENLGDGTFDMDANTFKCMLLTNSYTIDATDEVKADLGAVEVSGTGYTAGGETLTSVTWSESGGTVTLDAADAQWTSATFTARYAVIYASGTLNSLTDPLVCLFDFGSDKSVSNGTFTVQFNASGIMTLS